MITLRRFVCACLSIFVATACSPHHSGAIPSTAAGQANAASQSNVGGSNIAPASIPNRFASAGQRKLSTADLDSYIDGAVTGDDRKLARRLMSLMPPNRRGDFVYLSHTGHLVSNNTALLPYVTVKHGTFSKTLPSTPVKQGLVSTVRRSTSGDRKVRDYSDACSPPNPPPKAGGPYVRQVSLCGFVAGWGFVTLPPNTSHFVPGDAGHLYFELTAPRKPDNSQSATEGGFEVYSDSSIAPYARSTASEYSGNNGYVDLNNGGARYFASQRLAVFHGLTDNGAYVFTNSGLVPDNINPQTAWITSQRIQLQNSGWIFFDSPGDMRGQGGSDPLGHFSPCTRCSVSKVTSIAQNNTYSYEQDGSYFGLTSDYRNAILWEQVAFGNWAQNCEPGTSLCTFMTSSNPYRYWGGDQYYPNDIWSYSNEGPTGYGPYETYDGIDASAFTGGYSVARYPQGAFNEPLPPTPPPPCTVDSYGACGWYYEISMSSCTLDDGSTVSFPGWWIYQGYSDGQVSTFNGQSTPTSPDCSTVSSSWGGDPQTFYNDPNLPGPSDHPNSSPPY